MGRRLTSGERPVGRSSAFVCFSEEGVPKKGKGGSGPSVPFSLLLFYIEVGEAYASEGGRGQDNHSPFLPHHFGFFNKYKAYFVGEKPKEKGCRRGDLVFSVTGRKIGQQKIGKSRGFR